MKKACFQWIPALFFTLLIAMPALAAQAPNPESSKLNVNVATLEALQKVPGITPEIAAGIIKYREEMGDIQNLDELLEVKGITKELLGKLKQFISVDAIAGSECTC